MTKYMAFDPGGTTGWASWDDSWDPWSIKTGELGPQIHHRSLEVLLYAEDPHVVIYERFQYRPNQSPTPGEDILIAREYIGIVRLWTEKHGELIVPQTPAMAKGLWKDDMLRRAGVWISGSAHRRDAKRHLLYHLTVTEGRDVWVRATKPND